MSEREPDGSGRPHAMDGSAFDGPLDQTQLPPPSVPPEAPLADRLAALATWLEEFPFQSACVTGAKAASEAARRIEELTAEANALGERVNYYYELNRRLERYAAFEAIGHLYGGRLSVQCRNCDQCRSLSPTEYEQLQRETHERNGRVDL